MSNPKKNMIIEKVEFICNNVNELPTLEVTGLMNQLKEQIDLVTNELNDKYKSHCEEVESEYREIVDSILDFMKSIKLINQYNHLMNNLKITQFCYRMFSEGGNYGHKEAVSTINALNELKKSMLEKEIDVVELLKQYAYESIAEIRKWLSKMIKPSVLFLF